MHVEPTKSRSPPSLWEVACRPSYKSVGVSARYRLLPKAEPLSPGGPPRLQCLAETRRVHPCMWRRNWSTAMWWEVASSWNLTVKESCSTPHLNFQALTSIKRLQTRLDGRSRPLPSPQSHPFKMLNSLPILLIFLLPFLSSFFLQASHAAEEKPVAMFVFGDSVLDNGNNVYLSTSLSRADYLPYGLDMGGPNGRFTNARNPADILGQYLGLTTFVPAFLDPLTTGEAIIHGVNFGSAGSGILDTTLNTSSIPLNTQIDYFVNTTLPSLRSLMNESQLSTYLSEAIFVLNSGANDYEQSCFDGDNSSAIYCSLPSFTIYLVDVFTNQLKKFYSLGARKFVLFGIQVIGCSPLARTKSTTSDCMADFNYAAKLFNDRILKSIDNITQKMPGSNAVFINTYGIINEFIKNPSTYGYTVTNASCCETSSESYSIACLDGGTVCSNRSEYIFFDGVHTTQRVYEAVASKAFFSNTTAEVYPFNVMKLANLTSNSGVSDSVLKSGTWESYGKDVQ